MIILQLINTSDKSVYTVFNLLDPPMRARPDSLQYDDRGPHSARPYHPGSLRNSWNKLTSLLFKKHYGYDFCRDTFLVVSVSIFSVFTMPVMERNTTLRTTIYLNTEHLTNKDLVK